MSKRLDEEKCRELFDRYGTPEHVRGHCRAVSDTGYRIALALNRAGMNIDADLVKYAGLVHDLMRVHENHGEEAAKVLRSFGYDDEADVVKNHMYYDFTKSGEPTETDIVCLADRLVCEDEYVGLDRRLDYLINKPGKTEERTRRLLAKKKDTEDFISRVEEMIGCTIDSLFAED